jgi:hypothetical protein
LFFIVWISGQLTVIPASYILFVLVELKLHTKKPLLWRDRKSLFVRRRQLGFLKIRWKESVVVVQMTRTSVQRKNRWHFLSALVSFPVSYVECHAVVIWQCCNRNSTLAVSPKNHCEFCCICYIDSVGHNLWKKLFMP